jgi:hypothetical protein
LLSQAGADGPVAQLAAATSPAHEYEESATSLFRRTPYVRAEIAFYGPARTAVRVTPAPGRWPDAEADDRLTLATGLAAVAGHKSPDTRWPAFRTAMVELAKGINQAPSGPLPGDILSLDELGATSDLVIVEWQGEGRALVEAELVRARAAVLPRLGAHPDEAGPFREIAALALILAEAEDADSHQRLRLALAVEGLIFWFRDSDRRAPPHNALAFALNHVDVRLHERSEGIHPEF